MLLDCSAVRVEPVQTVSRAAQQVHGIGVEIHHAPASEYKLRANRIGEGAEFGLFIHRRGLFASASRRARVRGTALPI